MGEDTTFDERETQRDTLHESGREQEGADGGGGE
jgi:hypothetical protein